MIDTIPHYDVLVVGAGLAGLQCAMRLGKAGLHVLLVDRKSSIVESISTTGIFVRRTFEDFSFPEDCLGPPVRHVTLYSPAHRRLNLESPKPEFRVGRMRILYEHYLEECHRSGVAWIGGAFYAGSEPTAEGSLVRLETKNCMQRIHARFIVGADGAVSRVARDLDLSLNTEWIVGVEEVLTNVPLEGPPRLHCFLDPTLSPGYLAWVVHDGEEVHIGVGGYASRFSPNQALEAFRKRVSGIVNLSRAIPVERRGGRIPVGGILPRLANKRGLLVGDAAGAVSPLTAGGLDPCMRLSKHAAEVIEDYLMTRSHAVLGSYSGRLFRTRFTSRLWMRRMLACMSHRMFVEIGCAALRFWPLNRLAWHVFFGRNSFPDTARRPLALHPQELVSTTVGSGARMA